MERILRLLRLASEDGASHRCPRARSRSRTRRWRRRWCRLDHSPKFIRTRLARLGKPERFVGAVVHKAVLVARVVASKRKVVRARDWAEHLRGDAQVDVLVQERCRHPKRKIVREHQKHARIGYHQLHCGRKFGDEEVSIQLLLLVNSLKVMTSRDWRARTSAHQTIGERARQRIAKIQQVPSRKERAGAVSRGR